MGTSVALVWTVTHDVTTVSPPIPVKRNHLSRKFVSFWEKPVEVVDAKKARFRHGSFIAVYPSQEPANNKQALVS